MKFVFIAVNYNGSAHTEELLDSLGKTEIPSDDSIEALIVDNNSRESDLEAVRRSVSKRPFARLLPLNHNPGYFRGLNAGLDECDKNDDTLFIVGNNDLSFASDFLLNLKNIRFENDILVIAPNITTLEGRRQNPHVVDRVSRIELIKARIYFSNYYIGQTGRYISAAIRWLLRPFGIKRNSRTTKPEYGQMRIKRGIGACYVLTPHFFRHYERLDDRIFLWGEEALLSHQVESVGGATLYDPSIRVTHCESASVRFVESRARYEIVRTSYKIYREYL